MDLALTRKGSRGLHPGARPVGLIRIKASARFF
jgi:hypothetical protein